MILSQIYHTNRKYMSDGNLNKWKAYESLENVPVPEKWTSHPHQLEFRISSLKTSATNQQLNWVGMWMMIGKVQFFTFQFADSVSWKMEPLRAQQSDTV